MCQHNANATLPVRDYMCNNAYFRDYKRLKNIRPVHMGSQLPEIMLHLIEGTESSPDNMSC
jgi:hypothetical protein